MTFLKQVWYASAWGDDIEPGAPLARTIAGEPLLFWRTRGGQLHALLDRCPHRHAPLSLGQIDEEGVRCGYHGLKFDGCGACIDNPHGAIVSALAVRSYPVVERHKLVWLWMGTADAADPAEIPDLSFVDRTLPTAFSKGYLPTAADHRLLQDNILDLSHADYMHPHTLGGGSITRAPGRVEERGSTVFVQWLANNDIAIPVFRGELPTPDTITDMWTEVLWHPCGVMLLRAGAVPTGRPREEGLDTWNAHIMTPESAARTHYFYCNSRNYRTHDEVYNRFFADALKTAFETEDKPMVEAQQRRIGNADLFDLSPALLPIDNASMRARRIVSRLLAQEASAA